MKNKNTIIVLIAFLSIIAVALTILMIFLLTNHKKIFNFSHRVSDELILDETYDIDFKDIKIDSSASDIYIKTSNDNKVKVVIYGNKEDTKVDTDDERLLIKSQYRKKHFFSFNINIAKIEVYLPSDYDGKIEINNNYGNIDIDAFKNVDINIDEDCGDVLVLGGNNVSINNNYGDIELRYAKNVKIRESAGDIKVEEIDEADISNNFGDIHINKVNDYFDISNDCGDIKIDNIILNRNSKVKGNLGDIKIGNISDIYIDAKTDLGDVKINKNYPKSDITLTINNDCGDIVVNN